MDPDSPASRVGRTLWTVWSYIAEAVNRFFRSEPTNISENDPDSHQQNENLTANTRGRTELNAGRGEVGDEQALVSVAQVSSPRPVIAWELCSTDDHEVDTQHRVQQGEDNESNECQQTQGSREVVFSQAVDQNAGLVTADEEEKQVEDKMLNIQRIHEVPESDDALQTVHIGWTQGALSVDVEKDGSAKSEESAEEDDAAQRVEENLLESSDAEENGERQLEDLMAEDSEVDVNMAAALNIEKELSALMKEKTLQNSEKETLQLQEDVQGTDAVLLLDSENDASKQGANQLSSYQKAQEKQQNLNILEDSGTDRKQEVITERENAYELEDDIESAPEEPQSMTLDKCNDDLAVTQPQRGVCTDDEQVDGRTSSEVQTERTADVETEASAKEKDENLYTTDIEIEERCVDSGQTEDVELSGDCNDDKHSADATGPSTSISLCSESERMKETGGKFKNISSGVCEGWRVGPQKSPLCEEAQGGVPEHNNEPGGDENTTQRFLEEHDSMETHTTELPEEVESAHNAVGSHGADHSVGKEPEGEEEDSSGDIRYGYSLHAEEHFGGPGLNEAVSPRNTETPFGEQEIQEVAADSWKAGDDCSVVAGIPDLTDSTADETEELSYDTHMEDLKEAPRTEECTDSTTAEELLQFADDVLKVQEAEVQKMTELSFHKEFESAADLEQSSCSLLGEPLEPRSLENSAESEPFEDRGEYFDNAETKQMEKAKTTEDTEDHVQMKKSQQHSDVVRELDGKAETLFAESETAQTQNQLCDEALGMSSEEDEVDPEAKEKCLMPAEETDVNATYSGVTDSEEPFVDSDVIDDEILDLWIQTTLSEDTDDIMHKEGPESGEQVDWTTELLKEEPGEVSTLLTEKNEEPLVEFSSGDFTSVNDADMPSATVESGFWNPDPMTSTTKYSLDEMYHMLVQTPQPSLPQPDSRSVDTVRETTAGNGQSYMVEVESLTKDELDPDLSLDSSTIVNEDLEKKGKKSADEGGTEMTNNDFEDAQLHLLDRANAFINVEDPEVGVESLSDSLDEIEPESDDYGSGSEGTAQEDNGEFLSRSNRTHEEEEQISELGNLFEIHSSKLDFAAQRSRISVKNLRVRPPKHPRTLLNMPSLEPTPSPQPRVPAGLPSGGLPIGIKLPGLGKGFPVLNKVEQKCEPGIKSDEMDDKSREDEAQHKPKWMPPRHPGLGNPLMSELKAKLKKTPPDNSL